MAPDRRRSDRGGADKVIRRVHEEPLHPVTKKAVATIGGKALLAPKVTVNASGTDTVSGLVPANTGTAKTVSVTTEGGKVNHGSTFDYLTTLKVSPSVGLGSSDVLTVTGANFLTEDFVGTAAGDVMIGLAALGTAFTAGTTTVASFELCDSVQVETDSLLTCTTDGTVADGASSVRLLRRRDGRHHGRHTLHALARGATYTVADF